ncbi:23S rRNA (adenine(2503)-C(2))-methyltransferase RlmN [Fimbriiglobus ruber]|uniref:Probable dual-specificity RNA methyltransferase RlmN n=1 Tax=Fimbriiglobus ruber TaxID=1908690 RepID=A0A225E9M8_9BACT|nr:23S rRNA (adenine(2503)-C(2))-methyltransferase RlmN [Fimbriiglobus ruber]OWK47438.1 Ribosomal RNA large subunit methyltransferase N [Fimbriiglobus ruber]
MSVTLPIAAADTIPSPGLVKPALLEHPLDGLRAWFAERGQPPMRVRQVLGWVVERRATSFDEMSDLPKDLRSQLAEAFTVFGTSVARHLAARDGTHKLLISTRDNHNIECVLIQDGGRHTACVSTQVGCGMGCVFCASGLNGVARNLTPGEIVEQLVLLRNLTAPDRRLTHVVVMGMGEPLANLENLLDALAVAGDKNGLGIGARHVTISTVGLPPKIRRLADLGKQYHLAISLHAPNNTLRTEIVPTNNKTGIPEILAAADYFFEKTGRQVTFEYVVLGGLNDKPIHARQLQGLLCGRKAHVNLIPWNDVEGLPYKRPRDTDLKSFIEELRRNGVSVTVRHRKGSEIDAACGQLRREAEKNSQDPQPEPVSPS